MDPSESSSPSSSSFSSSSSSESSFRELDDVFLQVIKKTNIHICLLFIYLLMEVYIIHTIRVNNYLS